MVDRVGDLLRRQPHVHRLQDHSHHRDGEKRLEKSVAVPVENADRIAGSHADLLKSARQPADAVAQFGVCEAPEIAIDNFLAAASEQAGHGAVV